MNRIKELRKRAGLLQQELAKKLNISDSTLSGWENGKFEPDQKNLFALAEIFEVSIDYLLGRTDIPFQGERKRAQPSDADIKFALFGDVEIDDEVMAEVRDFAQFVAARKKREKG